MQEEQRLRGKKIENVNFVSCQVSRRAGKGKDAPKAEWKKVLVVVLCEANDKVIKCFFCRKKRHLKKIA